LLTVDSYGDLLPFAQRIVDERHAERQQRRNRNAKAKWWQFWRKLSRLAKAGLACGQPLGTP
jgi:hypothetical protein